MISSLRGIAVAITIDRSVVKVNGKQLPGIVKKIRVNNQIVFDQAQVVGVSGQKKQVSGWDDSDVTIDLTIINQLDSNGKVVKSMYDSLKELNDIFKKLRDGKPVVYPINHPHIKSRGITKVLFSKLSSNEGVRAINCKLDFQEYEPPVAIIQERTHKKNDQVKEQKQKKKENEPKPTKEESLKMKKLRHNMKRRF